MTDKQDKPPEAEAIGPDDVQQTAAALVLQAQRIAAAAQAGGPIKIEVEDQDGHPDEYVEFIRTGWRHKDLRVYEEAISTAQLNEVICRRVQGWKFTVDGEAVPFRPGELRKQLAKLSPDAPEADRQRLEHKLEASYREATDELDPYLAGFLTAAYRTAYSVVSSLGPNL